MRNIRWKKKNRHRSHIADAKGYTLVELIVTFALLAIFMTAVVACLPRITKIYTNLQAINRQKTICNTVSNQIRDELQTIRGVNNVDDALGVGNERENGYIVLLDESGQQVMISTAGAVSTGSAIKPQEDLTGDTIQFVVPRTGPYVGQMDTKGFDGYTMYKEKNKLLVDYHEANAISSGALVTRYYQPVDTEASTSASINLLKNITYDSTVYSATSEAGIIADGETVNVAYALNYPYAKPFYEGYELKTKFTIKKDAFYTYGDGTTESPARTYVNYINYTLSLWKDGHMKYSQDYVVNVQNAVPYLGTKAAVDPVVPDVPSRSPYDAYVVEGSVTEVTRWQNGNSGPWYAEYDLVFHIPLSRDDQRDCDRWKVNFPYIEEFTAIYPPETGGDYFASYEGKNLYVTVKNSGYNDEALVNIKMHTIGVMTEEQRLNMADLIHLTPAPSFKNSIPSDAKIDQNTISIGAAIVAYTISAGDTHRVRERVEIEFDSEIESVNNNVGTIDVKVDGKKIIILGRMIEKNSSVHATYWVKFKSSDVKPSPAKFYFDGQLKE